MPNGHLIIISGPIGSGKTTVAKELLEHIDPPLIYVEGDTFWQHFIKTTEDEGRQDNFRAVLRAMCQAAVGYAACGYNVILDFSIPSGYMEAVRKMVANKDVRVDFVVIRPSIEACAQRAKDREEGKISDYSMYKDMYQLFPSENAMTDEQSSAQQTAKQISEDLRTDKFRAI